MTLPFNPFSNPLTRISVGVYLTPEARPLYRQGDMPLERSKPTRGSSGASGYDLRATVNGWVRAHETVLVPTGVFIQMPTDLEAQIRSRSGMSTKGVVVANSPGTVDSDYRGEIKLILHNHSTTDFEFKAGDRLAQMVFAKVEHPIFQIFNEKEDMKETERGEGGGGSTGVK